MSDFPHSILLEQIKAIPEGLLVVDAKGKIISCNKAYIDLWNMPPAIVEAKDDVAALNYAMTQVEDAQAFFDRVQELYACQTPRSVRDVLHFKDGRAIQRFGKSIIGSDGISHGWAMYFRDITDQYRNEQELQRQKNLYRDALEGTSDAFVSFDFDWNILYINGKATAWGNLPADEIIGTNLWEAFPQLVGTDLALVYRTCMETRQPRHTEYFSAAVNRWYSVKVSPISQGLSVFIADITDTKKVEKENQEREDQFRLMANSIPQLGWMADSEGWIYWYNDRWYEYTGTTLDEMKGWGWKRVHHPDHVDQVVAVAEKGWRMTEPWELTFPLRRHDGEYRWFLTRIFPVKDVTGAVTHWIGTNTDIHDQLESEKVLKRSEEQLKQLSDFMPQIVWTTDDKGYHDFFNQRWYEFTGLSFEETKDTGWALVLHPDDFEPTWKKWSHSLRTGDLYETEYRMKRADGAYRWLLARAMPLRNESGEIVRWFGTCTDIHDQKVASDILEHKVAERTRDLQEANSYLHSINEELRQFNYIASHDLQEPLRKIMIFAERIRAQDYDQLSEGSRSFLERMSVSAERMSVLLKDLLDFSSTQREELFIQVNLNDTIKDIENDLELLIAQKSAVIQKEELPTLKAIPLQMHQLFYNMINNALKFTLPHQNPVIQIKGTLALPQLVQEWALAPDARYFHLTVTDNGIGFEQEFADRIFVLFKRLHSQKTFQGTGVGLALCKKVVENHHGRIWAESEPDRGATFHVVLPLL
ncbi:PAS domain-containing sensor histidine kinase [Salmonirosea aquatica]|uniref:histidine kinase n=1 Tax=Salmonirosea aquatica TaxID=2654236 RepID=A0A7C9BI95_9BACT|nr:PAS domain S-box protein [Cytophagaceae bacterium SJW1-29]